MGARPTPGTPHPAPPEARRMLRRALFACLLLLAPAARAQDVDLTDPSLYGSPGSAPTYWLDGWYEDDTQEGESVPDPDPDAPPLSLVPDDYSGSGWTPYGDVLDVVTFVGDGGSATVDLFDVQPGKFQAFFKIEASGRSDTLYSFAGWAGILVIDFSKGLNNPVVLNVKWPVAGIFPGGRPQWSQTAGPFYVPSGSIAYAAVMGFGICDLRGGVVGITDYTVPTIMDWAEIP